MSTVSSEHNEGWARLGTAIRDRRLELGLTQAQAARIAGLSVNGWGSRAEAGNRVRFATLERVETALRWRPGTCMAILRGDDGQAAVVAPPPGADPDGDGVTITLPLPREVLRALSPSDRTRAARAAVDAGCEVADILAAARRTARDITRGNL